MRTSRGSIAAKLRYTLTRSFLGFKKLLTVARPRGRCPLLVLKLRLRRSVAWWVTTHHRLANDVKLLTVYRTDVKLPRVYGTDAKLLPSSERRETRPIDDAKLTQQNLGFLDPPLVVVV